jgi:hypothetical protein
MVEMNAGRPLESNRWKEHAGTIVFAVFCTVLCGVGIAAGNMMFGNVKTTSATATRPAAGIMADVTTATPEPTATETPNFSATQTVIDETHRNQEIDLTRARADLAAMDAKIAQTNLEIEQNKTDQAKYAADKSATEAQKAENERKSIEARNEQIKLQIELQKLVNQQTEIKNSILAEENEQKAIIAVENRTNAQTGYNWGVAIGLPALGFFLWRASKNISKKTEPATETKNEAEEQSITLDNMIPATQVSSGGNAGFMYEIKITPAEYRMLKAAAVSLGGVFSRRKLNGENPTGQKFFVEERAEEILAMLREVQADGIQYAAYVGQMTSLTPEGWAWLRVCPTSPPPEMSPISAENTVKTCPTPPQNTEGEAPAGE